MRWEFENCTTVTGRLALVSSDLEKLQIGMNITLLPLGVGMYIEAARVIAGHDRGMQKATRARKLYMITEGLICLIYSITDTCTL
jgi:hypothetical protein